MKTTDRKARVAIVIGVLGCLMANAQPQPQMIPRMRGNSSASGGGGGGGYTSGGERGSVVQVIASPEVRAELNLNDAQQSQVSNILSQVKAKEDELWKDVRRSMLERFDAMRSFDGERSKKYEEANQQLNRATERIVAQLTPTQRAQLREFCRQALADESGFQTSMTRSQAPGGPIGSGGLSGDGSSSIFASSGGGTQRHEYASGGGPGGVVRVISYAGVQEQLKLSDEQREKIAEITGQLREFESSFEADLQLGRRPSFAQRNQQFEQRRQQVDSTRQAVARAGEEITQLLTSVQQKRLKEIRLQAQGADALFKPEIIRALGLTATQQIKLGKLREEANRRVFLESPEQRMALQREAEQRMISSALTPEQQRKLQDMKGKELAGATRFGAASAGGGSGAGGSSSSSAQPRGP
jgi:hypothetical protein